MIYRPKLTSNFLMIISFFKIPSPIVGNEDGKENDSKQCKNSRFKVVCEDDLTTLVTSAQATNTKYNTNWAIKVFKGEFYHYQYHHISRQCATTDPVYITLKVGEILKHTHSVCESTVFAISFSSSNMTKHTNLIHLLPYIQ